jgi:hypothetical protein
MMILQATAPASQQGGSLKSLKQSDKDTKDTPSTLQIVGDNAAGMLMSWLSHFPPVFLGVVVVEHAYGSGELGIGCSASFMAMVKGPVSVMICSGVCETTTPWLVFLNCYTQYNVYNEDVHFECCPTNWAVGIFQDIS